MASIVPEIHYDDFIYKYNNYPDTINYQYDLAELQLRDYCNSNYAIKLISISLTNINKILINIYSIITNSAPEYALRLIFSGGFSTAQSNAMYGNYLLHPDLRDQFIYEYNSDTQIFTIWKKVNSLYQTLNIEIKFVGLKNPEEPYIEALNVEAISNTGLDDTLIKKLFKQIENIQPLEINKIRIHNFINYPVITNKFSKENGFESDYFGTFNTWELGSAKYVGTKENGTTYIEYRTVNQQDEEIKDINNESIIQNNYFSNFAFKTYNCLTPNCFFRGDTEYFVKNRNNFSEGWEFYNTDLKQEFIKINNKWLNKSTGYEYGKDNFGINEPTNPIKGQIFFNTKDNQLEIYLNSQWIKFYPIDYIDNIKTEINSLNEKALLRQPYDLDYVNNVKNTKSYTTMGNFESQLINNHSQDSILSIASIRGTTDQLIFPRIGNNYANIILRSAQWDCSDWNNNNYYVRLLPEKLTFTIDDPNDYNDVVAFLHSGSIHYNTSTKCLCVLNNRILDTKVPFNNGFYDIMPYILAGNSQTRPTPSRAGISYFDTTLNKPIWWTGTKWVDATGTDV